MTLSVPSLRLMGCTDTRHTAREHMAAAPRWAGSPGFTYRRALTGGLEQNRVSGRQVANLET